MIDKLWHYGIAFTLEFIAAVLNIPVFYSALFIAGMALAYEFFQIEQAIKDKEFNFKFALDSFFDLVADGLGIFLSI